MKSSTVKFIFLAVAVSILVASLFFVRCSVQPPPGVPPIISLKPKLPGGGGNVNQTDWTEQGAPLPANGMYQLSPAFQQIENVEWYVEGELQEDFDGIVLKLKHVNTDSEHRAKLAMMGDDWRWLVTVQNGSNAPFVACDGEAGGDEDCEASVISPPGAMTGWILSALYLDNSAAPDGWELKITLEE